MRVETTPYGAAAYDALRREVAAAKAGDPLATVTLLVPSELVGVTARRALARDPGTGSPGIAALQVLTLRRLAEALAGTALAAQGRRPLTSPVLAAAVRTVLAREPGLFAPVAEHVGTVQALAQAHRALRTVPDERLDAVVTGDDGDPDDLVVDVLRIHRRLESDLATGWYDGDDLLAAATDALREHGWPATVVAFLLQDLGEGERALLAGLADATDLRVVAGLTGVDDADAGVVAAWPVVASTELPDGWSRLPTDTVVLHATDADEEVRAVVGRVVEALAAGTPGHRIAVFYGSPDPYARILHEQLEAAGVTVHGRGVRPAAERLLGRTLLRLLDLPRHAFRRNEVMAVLAGGGVRPGGRRVPSTRWERLSRDAGVVEGLGAGERDDWQRLAAVAALLREQADAEEASPEPREYRIARNRRDANGSEDLLAFVTDLRARLAAVDAAGSWSQASAHLVGIWQDLLDGDDPAWPPEAAEREAAARVGAVVRGLAGLDRIGGAPTLAAIREILELELVDDLGRVGSIGVGVHVGPLGDAVGADVDLVAVVGMAEGLTPRRLRDDPLLPDSVRERSGGALPTLRERVAADHRRVLAALAAAPSRVLSFPRGDLRSSSERVPSRWAVPVLQQLTGDDTVTATSWREAAEAAAGRVVEVPSYSATLERLGALTTEQEWRVRRIVTAGAAGDPDLAADRAYARALASREARRSREFTRFDGNLAGVEGLPDPTASTMVSPSSLQAWVSCPHAYLMHHVLHVDPVEDPEELLSISALDRGSGLHAIYERHIQEALDAGPPGPRAAWTARQRTRLAEIAAEVLDELEAAGLTGAALLWEHDRSVMLGDVEAFVDHDNRRRSEQGLTPLAAELPFGRDGTPPVEIDLPDDRVLRLVGQADRVDARADGSLLVVDYKTGSPKPYEKLGPDDPTKAGRLLQLPVYAVAARDRFGDESTPVRSEYLFATRRWGFEAIGYDVTDDVLDRTRAVLAVIADGIAQGMFIARPREHADAYACPYCDIAGPGEVVDAWRRKTETPARGTALAAYLGLVDGLVLDEEDAP